MNLPAKQKKVLIIQFENWIKSQLLWIKWLFKEWVLFW